MPQIGALEILLVGVIALIVFGPQRLPEIARTIGRTLNELRKQAGEVRAEFEAGLSMDDDTPAPQDEQPVPSLPETAVDDPERRATEP